jgi:hypothetical protein
MRAPVVCCAVVVLIAPTIASAQDACGNVAAVANSLPGTTIVSSKAVPADDRLPAFCEVHATISPVAGSHIGAVYRLPMNWNGKVLGIGGGGFAGNLTLGAAAIGLSRGYAVIQNDMGHESTGALDPKFAIKAPGQPNVEGIVDFGHRATHVATDVGKRLISSYYGMPLMRGGESDWVTRMVGTKEQPRGLNSVLGAPFMSYIVKHDPSYDIMSFDPERDMKTLANGLAAEVHQQNPDISTFVGRGGKLLLWHGFNDPGPSPLSTIEYFERVREKVPAAKESVRLFLAPGVLHCGGGAGPDRFDALTAMERWVEQGTPPASMIATKANSPISRPLCPYPQLAKYKGTGDQNDAANFACAAP